MNHSDSEKTAGLTYSGRPRTWGLRFSLLDGIVLALAFIVTFIAFNMTAGFSLLILYVVLHFFLFCNVFRIRRKPELIWAVTFVGNCSAWLVNGNFHLGWITLCQSLITIALLIHEIRLPWYHGIFAQFINPRLEDYLADRLDDPTTD